MLFPTVDFAIFFFIVFFVSWQMKNRGRKLFLLGASYFFYAYWNWGLTLLLFSCSLINYCFGLLLGKYEGANTRKWIIRFAVLVNLGILFFYKYFTFATAAVNSLLLAGDIPFQFPLYEIILPVGVSFFTFQAMSYVIDVYRKEIPATVSMIDLFLFISFFPQLVAGPIVRASDFLPQLNQLPDTEDLKADRAFLLICSGLFKKVVVANYLAALFVDPVFDNPAAYSTIDLLLGVYGYAVQIYCDFSAYSDIAIGVALLLGYDFMTNFEHPYRASSLQEFWKRWHISLSTWLRDYLYIPLGGSRKGKLRTFLNLFLTMLLGGIWHGAAWHFVCWGLLHGLGLCLERLFTGKRAKDGKASPVLKAIGVLFTFHFVCLGWIFFRANSLELAYEYLQAMAAGFSLATTATPFVLLLIGAGLVIHFIPAGVSSRLRFLYDRLPLVFQGLLFGLFLIILGAFSAEGVAPFIYFQF